MKIKILIALMILDFSFRQAQAMVTRIEIHQRETAFAGKAFPGGGVYEKIVGKYWAELDPNNARNSGIVDLDKAPLNKNGRVAYSAEFYILTPRDPKKGNNTLLYEIANRGYKSLLWMLNFSPLPPNNDPETVEDAGDGFLMRHGYTLVWSGVYGDVTHAEDANALTIQLPVARNVDGSVIEQEIWDECNFSQASLGSASCDLSYPVPRMEKSEATLWVRERRSDAPVEIPRVNWMFSSAGAIELLPRGKLFEPGLIYQFAHRASSPPVMGIGLAAIRDLVSFLRDTRVDSAKNPNPLFGRIRTTLMLGWSQSGRMVREFVYRGFNRGEIKVTDKIFNGVMVMGAATRPFVNFRFAQPVRAPDKQHGTIFYPDSSFPFAYEVQTDSLTQKTDGILQECLSSNTCPKVFHVVTSNEYWHYKNSQVTTDTLGQHDGKLPPNVRAYLMAGMPHSPYAVNAPGVAEQPHNEIRYTYLLRNLLTRLKEWSELRADPPPSVIPTIANKTLVPVSQVKWPKIPGVTFAGPVITRHHLFDYGPDFIKGIVKTFPDELPPEYPPLVPQVIWTATTLPELDTQLYRYPSQLESVGPSLTGNTPKGKWQPKTAPSSHFQKLRLID